MTALRSVAMKVAAFTVRHASTGSREWAEGLAREVEFIAEDWKAFAWALSSMRVLLHRRGSSFGSLAEAADVAQRQVRNGARSESMVMWFSAMGIFAYAMPWLDPVQPSKRAGIALRLVVWIGLLIQGLWNRHSSKNLERTTGDWRRYQSDDIDAWIMFYKAKLEQRLEQLESPRLCLGTAFMICLGPSFMMDIRSPLLRAATMLLLLAVMPMLFFVMRGVTHRQLRRLNELIGGSKHLG